MMRRGQRFAVTVLVVAGALAGAMILPLSSELSAQEARRGAAAPYLEPGHWALDALRRMEALGLLGDDYDRAGWTVDRNQALRLMERALERSGNDPALSDLVGAYLDRLRLEFPGADVERGDFRRGAGEGGVAYRHVQGEALTAVGWPPDVDGWPPEPEVLPTALPRERTPTASVDISGYGGTSWAGRAQVTGSADGLELGDSYLIWDPGLPSLWVGRRQLRLGPGSGGVVLSGRRALDGGGLELDRFRLPGFLRSLGPARFQTAIARLGKVARLGEVAPDNPLLWTMRGSIQPHPRLTVGVNRAVMVPGPEQMTAEWLVQFPLVLIGKHPDGELNRQDNQIVAVDIAYNAPLPSMPVMLYVEWGFEDSAGAWKSVPGVVAGAYVPRIPGATWLAATLEHADFSESCCGNPWWYRHRGFKGGWTDDRRPLGHAVGGHGRESSLRLDVAGLGARALTGVELYHRERGIENLYAPTRQGTSTGGALRASLLLDSRFRVLTEVEHERGEGWRRTGVSVGGGVRF